MKTKKSTGFEFSVLKFIQVKKQNKTKPTTFSPGECFGLVGWFCFFYLFLFSNSVKKIDVSVIQNYN